MYKNNSYSFSYKIQHTQIFDFLALTTHIPTIPEESNLNF